MAEVNIGAWGDVEDWIDGVTYDNDMPEDKRIKHSVIIHDLVDDNKLNVGIPFDRTISYCGLGVNAPLSHITHLRYHTVRWNGGWFEGQPFSEVLYDYTTTDNRTITNFGLGSTDIQRGNQNGILFKGSSGETTPKKQRWTHDATPVWGGNLFDNWNRTYATSVLTQLPVKNTILVPMVKCINRLTGNISCQIVDLKSYLDTNTQYNIFNYPYVVSVGVKMHTASSPTKLENNQRTDDLSSMLNSLVLLDETTIYKDVNPDNLNPIDDDITFNTCFNYSTAIDFNSFLPIMGVLNDFGIQGGTGYGNTIKYTPSYIYMDGTGQSIDTKPDVKNLQEYSGEFSCLEWAGINDMQVKITEVENPQSGDAAVSDNNYMVFYMNPGTVDEFREKVRRAVACFGLFFVDGGDDLDKALDDPAVMLGILEDGIGNGNYSYGERNRDQDQWNWDDMHENEYDPSDPPLVDPNNYLTPMTYNQPWIDTPNKLYVLNAQIAALGKLDELYNKLWYVIDDNYDPEVTVAGTVSDRHYELTYSDFSINNFLTLNPIDSIVSIKLFPYNTAETTTPTGLKLGHFSTGIQAYVAHPYKKINCGVVDIFPYFGNCWMDRLTEYTLYAPFCGTLKLDPNIYMGKSLHLDYLIDQITGACTANISIVGDDGVSIHEDSISGTIACDIPITGINQATIQSQIFNANQQLKSGLLQTALGIGNSALQIGSSIANGNALQGASAAFNGMGNFLANDIKNQTNEYNLHHNEVAPRTVGSASPLTGMMMDYIPRLLISVPTIPDNFNEGNFAKTKGYACLISGTIGNNHGYCVAQNPKLDIACTETEKEMIRSLLASGVYV